jgi:hypothetical protein
MDVINSSPGNKDQLVLSIFDPSRGWQFETNEELDIMHGSINQVYLKESREKNADDRIEGFLEAVIVPLLESEEAENYSSILEYLRICNMLRFEQVIKTIYVKIADRIISKNMPFYVENFSRNIVNVLVKINSQVQKIFSDKFTPLYMDEDIQDEVEHMVEHNSDTLLENFTMIINSLEKLTVKMGKTGLSDISRDVNEKTHGMTGQSLVEFLTRFHKFVDKSKPKDWIHPSAQLTLSDTQVNENLINELRQIDEHELQYYMVELFAMMGKSIMSSVDKKAGIIELVFSSKDKCLLSDFELDEIFEVAKTQQWLLSSTKTENSHRMMRSCWKTVEGDLETFVFRINPTGKSRCEIVVQRQDSGEIGNVSREISILLDTHDLYTYGNSCYRDTVRQKNANVENPGSYTRLLL